MEEPRNAGNHGIFSNVDTTIKLTVELVDLVEKFQEITSDGEDQSTILSSINEKSRSILGRLNNLPYSIEQTRSMIKDILSNIHISRAELRSSAEGLIQKTGNQLEKVTAATEDATNKIMDVTEKLGNDMMDMTESVQTVRDALSENISEEVAAPLDVLDAKLMEGQTDTYQIMDYLQFQDITSQQISHAYALLEETERKLLGVASLLEGLDNGITNDSTTISNKAFDPDAHFDSGQAHDSQSMIDDMFNKKK